MTTDHFAPAFRVRVNGTALAADISKNILEVSVVHELDTPDHFSLSLANAYPQMRWTHTKDADLFKEGVQLTIAMGYGSDLRPMFDGEVTSISPRFPESGSPTVRIEGYTRLHWLQGSVKTRTFQNATDKQMAETIARDLGLTPRVEETSPEYPYVIQYNQTDLAFLMERARRIRFEVKVEGRSLLFRPGASDQGQLFTLQWGRTLRSFTPRMNTMRQVEAVAVQGWDVQKRERIVGRAGAGDEEVPTGGGQTGAQAARRAFGRPREETHVQTPVASQEEADRLARAIYNRRALDFVTGSGSSIGNPDLRAGSWLELKGLGPRFTTRYYVDQTTHSISAGGYTTSFTVRSNALP